MIRLHSGCLWFDLEQWRIFLSSSPLRPERVWIPAVSSSECTKGCFYGDEDDRSLSWGGEFSPSKTAINIRIDPFNVRIVTLFMWFSERKKITSVSSDCINCLIKFIYCVSLEVEIEFINIIVISCFKRTAIYEFYVHLRTGVPQVWNAPILSGTFACCTNRACFICFKGKLPHAPLQKTSQV